MSMTWDESSEADFTSHDEDVRQRRQNAGMPTDEILDERSKDWPATDFGEKSEGQD